MPLDLFGSYSKGQAQGQNLFLLGMKADELQRQKTAEKKLKENLQIIRDPNNPIGQLLDPDEAVQLAMYEDLGDKGIEPAMKLINDAIMRSKRSKEAGSRFPTRTQAPMEPVDATRLAQQGIYTTEGMKSAIDYGAAMEPKRDPYTLAPGAVRFGPDNQPVAVGGEKEEKTPNEVELTRRALSGDKEAQAILDSIRKARVDVAAAGARSTMDVKMEGMSIPGLADSVASGLMASEHIRNAFGTPIQAKVETEVRKKYPKFSFIMNDANSKWSQNPGNMRTIAMTEASLPRLLMLDEQVQSLGNTDIPTINKVMRVVARETGKPEYTNFEANRNAIVQEINTALSGSATSSDLRIRIELENIQAARSPTQLTGAIHNLREALLSRLDTSLAVPYPPEVVRGEKTISKYKEELFKKYRGNFGTASIKPTGGFDAWLVDAKKANPNASDQELQDYYNQKYGVK